MKRLRLVALTAVLLSMLVAAPASAGSTTFYVNTTLDTVDANPGDGNCADSAGACSLRAAVQEANSGGGSRRIVLENDEQYRLTIAGAGEDLAATGDLDVSMSVAIDGNDSRVDGNELDRIFDVQAGASLSISRLNLENGSVTDDSGGAIRNAGQLQLDRSKVAASSAIGTGASGGGVFNNNGVFHASRSTLTGNEATRAGGAIESLNGFVSLDRVELTYNTTGPMPGNGGGLHITGDGDAVISRSTVTNNSAALEGGGLWNSVGTMNVDRTNVSDNVAAGAGADDGGGGLFNNGGELNLDRVTVVNNDAPGTSGSGGGIFNNAGVLTVDRSEINRNYASRAGGGIETLNGTVNLERVELDRNETGPNPGNGGGLHTTGAGSVRINRSDVTRNVAANEGGGLWNSAVGTMIVTRTTIRNNQAPTGPNVFNVGGIFTIDGTPVPAG